MTEAITFHPARPARAVGRSRRLLVGGVLAGPIFVGSALVQGLTRDGFDFRRHPVSVLSTGDLGWIQIATFLATGLLTIGGAGALRRTEPVGAVRLSRLLTLYGVGLVGAGLFSADPVDGFPAGTPRGAGQISWHGGLHFVAAAVGFVALIMATVLVARRAVRAGDRAWATLSLATGAYFAVAWVALIVRPGPVTMVGFGLAVLASWAWVTATLTRAARAGTT
ncbi:DUF998 domain-containing protein [Micromonospora krabiensis]|uniref:DUF998 domain-containing protein n=1 Tax=Micromonospora krabiensis TaxID=307121 RepID=A0A1C3N9L7_9ACTN|nr:DUF998 domain-containing protein [Micromonospora krabiensis]SBV29268.1 Protein of unknown function [Micromonospora krabiensis]